MQVHPRYYRFLYFYASTLPRPHTPSSGGTASTSVTYVSYNGRGRVPSCLHGLDHAPVSPLPSSRRISSLAPCCAPFSFRFVLRLLFVASSSGVKTSECLSRPPFVILLRGPPAGRSSSHSFIYIPAAEQNRWFSKTGDLVPTGQDGAQHAALGFR